MDVQVLNESERLARLDSYFSELKEMIPFEPKKDSEDEKDEAD